MSQQRIGAFHSLLFVKKPYSQVLIHQALIHQALNHLVLHPQAQCFPVPAPQCLLAALCLQVIVGHHSVIMGPFGEEVPILDSLEMNRELYLEPHWKVLSDHPNAFLKLNREFLPIAPSAHGGDLNNFPLISPPLHQYIMTTKY